MTTLPASTENRLLSGDPVPGLRSLVARHGSGLKLIDRGTHRTRRASETIIWARQHFAEMGITRVANTTGLDHIGIPVVMVVRPNSRGLAVSQGKGLTLDAAKASGIMECIELWHGEHFAGPVYRASTSEMHRRGRTIQLDRLPRAYGGRPDPGLQMLWVTGTDLVTDERTAVPEEIVGSDCTHPKFPGAGCFLTTTNGLASGNHPLEAIVHGLCEVIERDAITLLELSGEDRRASKRIDLDTVIDPDCRDVLDRCAAAGATVVAWDATSDIGLPVVDCELFDTVGDPWRPLPTGAGHGCHLTREVALLRAVTEAAQSRLTLIAGSRDDAGHGVYERSASPELRTRANQLRDEPTHVSFDQLPSTPTPTLADDLSHVIQRLIGVGLDEIVTVDLSRPEFDIPVWRVVVPGLEHRGPQPHRYRPGRRGQEALDAVGSATPK